MGRAAETGGESPYDNPSAVKQYLLIVFSSEYAGAGADAPKEGGSIA